MHSEFSGAEEKAINANTNFSGETLASVGQHDNPPLPLGERGLEVPLSTGTRYFNYYWLLVRGQAPLTP